MIALYVQEFNNSANDWFKEQKFKVINKIMKLKEVTDTAQESMIKELIIQNIGSILLFLIRDNILQQAGRDSSYIPLKKLFLRFSKISKYKASEKQVEFDGFHEYVLISVRFIDSLFADHDGYYFIIYGRAAVNLDFTCIIKFFWRIKMINLIDQQGELNSQLVGFPKASVTISIFGTQASGKSTVLNHAFGTEFLVLDTLKSRGRCTKGVWFHNINNKNIIDTQGFDSSQRTEQQKIFEKQLSLFCVAISDVVLVNVFMYEIGRYTGGHLDILDSIFKVGERLVASHKKKIIFLIRDCTQDADKTLLKIQLEKQVNSLLKKYQNKILKCTLDYFYMSHYVYEPQAFIEEAKKLTALLTVKQASQFSNYRQSQRLIYIKQLWKKIRSFQTEIDLKSIDDALKIHVFQRLKSEILQKLNHELQGYTSLNDARSYERYIESLKKISFDHYSQNRPKHIKLEEVQTYSNKMFELFQPTAIKYFNEVILKNIENQLEGQLNNQIQKHKNNKRLSSTTFKKKKEVIDQYKRIINNHKQYTLLLKHFNEKISQIISKQERKFTHLFNLFEINAQKQLNKQIDKQIESMIFKPEVINQRIKSLCQEYQYNEWEVNFKEIWQRVTFRCMEKIIPEYIQQMSVKCNQDIWIFSGDQTTNIIAFHTTMQRKIINFCKEILQFLHQDITFSQPLSRIKDQVRQNLAKRLLQQNRRFKISLFLISILLLLLYGEMEIIFGWLMKKKKKRIALKIYWYGSLLMVFASLFQQYRAKSKVQTPSTSNQ